MNHIDTKNFKSINEYRNNVKLKDFVNLSKFKLTRPKRNILNNVSINKALNSSFKHFKNSKVNYSNYEDSKNIYNDNSIIPNISNVFSHRPLV